MTSVNCNRGTTMTKLEIDIVDRAISEQVKAAIRDKLQDFDVTITRRLTDV